jgi:hypothetical protein
MGCEFATIKRAEEQAAAEAAMSQYMKRGGFDYVYLNVIQQTDDDYQEIPGRKLTQDL